MGERGASRRISGTGRPTRSVIKTGRKGKRRGKPFVKGGPPGPGRPPGMKNKASGQIKAFFGELLDRPAYMQKFLKDWDKRKVHPSIELNRTGFVGGLIP